MEISRKIIFRIAVIVFMIFLLSSQHSLTQNNEADSNELSIPPSNPYQKIDPLQPQKLALLVGINDYQCSSLQDLSGCVNDVENMKALLVGKFEFPFENIVVLSDTAATHEAIVNTFQTHLINRADSNDIVVFYFSGHGSKMRDVSGDEIDRWDETLVPYDSRDPAGKVFDISDDEINRLLRQLLRKTKNFTFIFDSCHSGTAARGSEMARTIPPDERIPPSPPDSVKDKGTTNEGESDLRPQGLNYVLISGCKSDEFSYEYYADGKIYGAMTFFLTQELRNSGKAVTYRDIMDNVKGNVNAARPRQNPQLEGANFDQFVFRDSTSISQHYILASPSGRNNAKLSAGIAHGLSEGSIFEIYKPRTKKFKAPEKPIATMELTTLTSFTAEGKILEGEQILEYSRAIEREHKFADPKLFIYYQNISKSKTLQKVKAELDQFPYIKSILKPSGYHLLLRQAGNEIVTEGGDTTEISPRVNITDPDAVNKVVAQVNSWTRWFNILSIVNPAPALEVNFTINAIDKGQSRDPFQRVGKPEATLFEGEELQCIIENKSGFQLYLTILDLSTDGSVAVIFPEAQGAAEILPENSSWVNSVKTYLPEGKSSIKDILKVFLTTQPIDFYFLTRDAMKGTETRSLHQGMDDPLGQLLANALLSTKRGVQPVKLGNWVTTQRMIEVRRR